MYTARRPPGPFARVVLFGGLLALGAFYGLMCSLLPAWLLYIPLMPVLILAALCLWMLPDVDTDTTGLLYPLMLWYLGLFAAWPNYVAVNLPGLPWITPTRIAMGGIVGVFLFSLAISAQVRAETAARMRTIPVTYKLFCGFWILTTLSLPFSNNLGDSLSKYVNNQIFWTMLFAVTCYLAVRPGFVMRACQVMVCGCMVTVVLGLHEYHTERVFYLEYLPSFLKVDEIYLAKAAGSQARAGTDVYRVHSTMLVSLYYAQYMAIMFPLIVFMGIRANAIWKRVLLGLAAAAAAVVMYGTNARSAMVGLVLTIGILPLFLGLKSRKDHPNAITPMAVLMAYPFFVGVLTLIVLFWRRARVAVLGGGQHQASSDAREAQWEMGLPKVWSHPLGHGPSQSGSVLGYTNRGGEQTIDTYYLSLLLDYGPLGLPVFLALFILPMWFAFHAVIRARTVEEQLAAPLAIGIFNFAIIAGVLSSENCIPLAFAMLGLLIGIIVQQRVAVPVETVPTLGSGQLALPQR